MSTRNAIWKHITHYHNNESGSLHQYMFSKSQIGISPIRNTVSERKRYTQ